ncbi:MAG: hypothetical protein JRH08_16320 [Deltaproteobacteria bacterium]|nr:hypothetical protein [Deltaproteobacteria bacterium]
MKKCDRAIQQTLELVQEMLQLADYGDAVREDDGSAFKIQKLAEAEKKAHIRKGWWAGGDEATLN